MKTAMTSNPFVRLYEAPVETLTLAAYLLVLLAVLLLTIYALGRNLMTLYLRWESEGWSNTMPPYPPGDWMARAIAVPVVLAVDLLLIAAFFYFLA